jgi:hypothetical protein
MLEMVGACGRDSNAGFVRARPVAYRLAASSPERTWASMTLGDSA